MVYIILSIIIGILLIDKILTNKSHRVFINKIIQTFRDTAIPCSLIVTINYNQEQESTITDFSKYEEFDIVNLTINRVEDAGDNRDIDGKPHLYSNAVVWQLEDTWLWKTL